MGISTTQNLGEGRLPLITPHARFQPLSLSFRGRVISFLPSRTVPEFIHHNAHVCYRRIPTYNAGLSPNCNLNLRPRCWRPKRGHHLLCLFPTKPPSPSLRHRLYCGRVISIHSSAQCIIRSHSPPPNTSHLPSVPLQGTIHPFSHVRFPPLPTAFVDAFVLALWTVVQAPVPP